MFSELDDKQRLYLSSLQKGFYKNELRFFQRAYCKENKKN